MKTKVCWDVALCNLAEDYRSLSFDSCLRYYVMKKAARSSETSLNIYQTPWCSMTEDIVLQFMALY
jgi:hypothetical protein